MAVTTADRFRRGVAALRDRTFRTILDSPAHALFSARLLVIDVRGRRSGRHYRLPVGYVEYEGTVLIGTAGVWHRNLGSGTPVEIRWRGRLRRARPEVITDAQRGQQLYVPILRRNPVHGRFVGIRIGPGGIPDLEEVERAFARGVAVVRLTVLDDDHP